MGCPALMAKHHTLQDTPSRAAAKAPGVAVPLARAQRVREAAVVFGLGASAWFACAGWPSLARPDVGAGPAFHATALITLALGVFALFRGALPAARTLLLCAYPGALACAVARMPEAVLDTVHGPWTLGLAVLALGAHAAGSGIATRAGAVPLAVEVSPLEPSEHAAQRPHAWLFRLVLTMFGAGACAIAVIAPRTPSFREVEAAWSDAAGAAAVLTAVVACALAVSVLAVHLSSLLRRADAPPQPTAPERRLRIATLLFVSLLGGVVYFTIT